MNRRMEGGSSNIKHGDHAQIETNNTSDARFNTSTNHTEVNNNGDEICNNNSNNMWVRNISHTPLTEEQVKILLQGPNFAIVPKSPPVGKYITSIECTCSQHKQGEEEELRGEIKTTLKRIQPSKSNITREESKTLAELRKDKNRIILTADKGVSIVVMDREEYIRKAQELLEQTAYKLISNDPTTKYKNKLISLLKIIKAEGGINEVIYRRLYPQGQALPNSMAYLKCTNKGCHSGP